MEKPTAKPAQDSASESQESRPQIILDSSSAAPQPQDSKMEPLCGNEAKVTLDENEQKLQEMLKNITNETSQLSSYLIEENKLVNELCTSLKEILKKLGISLDIPPQDIPLKIRVKRAVLEENGNLTLTNEEGDTETTFLAGFPPETVMAVLWIVIPEISRVVSVKRRRMASRISFFQGLRRELGNLAKAVSGGNEEPVTPESKTGASP